MSKKSNNKSGMSMKTKWIITGILCVLAVLTVVIVAADGCFDFKPGSVQSNNKAVAESAAPDAEKDTAKTGGTSRPMRDTRSSRFRLTERIWALSRATSCQMSRKITVSSRRL